MGAESQPICPIFPGPTIARMPVENQSRKNLHVILAVVLGVTLVSCVISFHAARPDAARPEQLALLTKADVKQSTDNFASQQDLKELTEKVDQITAVLMAMPGRSLPPRRRR